jgi:hypothetical protein
MSIFPAPCEYFRESKTDAKIGSIMIKCKRSIIEYFFNNDQNAIREDNAICEDNAISPILYAIAYVRNSSRVYIDGFIINMLFEKYSKGFYDHGARFTVGVIINNNCDLLLENSIPERGLVDEDEGIECFTFDTNRVDDFIQKLIRRSIKSARK